MVNLFKCGPGISNRIFDAKLGPTIHECVAKSLGNAAALHGSGACFQRWMEEAFADLIFMRHFDSVVFFEWECHAMTDFDHGPPSIYTDCWLQDPKNQKLLCKSKAAGTE